MEDCLHSHNDKHVVAGDTTNQNVNQISSGQLVDRLAVRKMSPDHIQASEGMTRLCRRSFDYNMFCSDPEIVQPRNLSHSDSELDRSHRLPCLYSDLTAEYLGFPRRLTEGGSESFLHKLDHTPIGVTLNRSESDEHNSKIMAAPLIDDEGISHSFNAFPLPKIEFSAVDVGGDEGQGDVEANSGKQNSPQILMEGVNYESEDYILQGPSPWIQLEPSSHMLLSPRSSNGSISSFRSSNADSAIEMLTPDEEVSDPHDGPEATLPADWESNTHINYPGTQVWSSKKYGAIKKEKYPSHQYNTDSHPSSWQCSLHQHPQTETSHSHTSVTASTSLLISPTSSCAISQLPVSHQHVSAGNDSTILQTPEVIISDFSAKVALEQKNNSQTENKSSQTCDPVALQSYLSPKVHGDSHDNIQRSLSSSSISSNESSTYSIFSDSSQDVEAVDDNQEYPVNIKKKQSSWKKIRNIVHWSPFIQQFKRRKYPWIQLAGHQGNFQAGDPGAILKKYDKREHQAFNKLMKDMLRPYVPEYRGEVAKDGECYLQLQDLLCEFEAPCVMDIKMGCRTYLEDELVKAREKPTLRKDMYQKMVEVDPNAPTEAEHAQKAITKPRYMKWRDDISSSAELGFRIEGIRKSDGAQVKNFKTTKDKPSVKECLKLYVEGSAAISTKYLRRLKAIRATQEDSPFFKSHEVIGSSLLFVHDKMGHASIWMIDFGKTVPLPGHISVTHKAQWTEGNHEDGYLHGIDYLIEIFTELQNDLTESLTDSETVSCTNTSDTDHVKNQSCSVSMTNNDTESMASGEVNSDTGVVNSEAVLASDTSDNVIESEEQVKTNTEDVQRTKEMSTHKSAA